jgi:hypothetical protein
MSGRRRPLATVRITNPCPAAWEQMSGDDRVRFCPQCRLNVYNLSAMSREEAEAFVEQREGRVCLRLYRRADGTILTRDCPVGLRAVRRRLAAFVAAVAGGLLGVLLGLFSAAKSREEAITWLRHVGPIRPVVDWLYPPPPPDQWYLGW